MKGGFSAEASRMQLKSSVITLPSEGFEGTE